MIRDSIASALKTAATLVRADSWDLNAMGSLWQNLSTGLGGTSRDRMTSHVPTAFVVLQPATLESLYYGDFLARRIVSAPVNKAFEQGFSVDYTGDNERSESMTDDIQAKCNELSLEERARQAAKLGRLYGGAGLLLGVNGSDDIEKPLIDEQVRSVDSIVVQDRRDISVASYQYPSEPTHFSEHRSYIPSSQELSSAGLKLHSSRLVPFGAADTARRDRRQHFQGWDASVLQPVWEVLRTFQSNRQSVAAMLQDSSQGILKLKDLWRVIAEHGMGVLDTQLSVIQEKRWSGRIMPISSDEDFQWIERSFAGIPQLLLEDQALVAAAANMPITVLFGRSPAGMSATGEHDTNNWHSTVASLQRTRFTPPVKRIIQLVARELGAQDPENFTARWPSLEQLSSKQAADLEKVHAETDDIRIDQGMPEETILVHRYGGGEYRADPPNLTSEDIAALEANAGMERNKPEPPPLPPHEEEPGEGMNEPSEGTNEPNKGADAKEEVPA